LLKSVSADQLSELFVLPRPRILQQPFDLSSDFEDFFSNRLLPGSELPKQGAHLIILRMTVNPLSSEEAIQAGAENQGATCVATFTATNSLIYKSFSVTP
jgi:hypothetical protein